MRSRKVLVLAAAGILSSAGGTTKDRASYVPREGFVPDEATAVLVAEAILSPIYGRQQVESERPFHAVLVGDTWHVTGSQNKYVDGGVAEAEIAKVDGRILRVIHGK